jgi:hypothetical protein
MFSEAGEAVSGDPSMSLNFIHWLLALWASHLNVGTETVMRIAQMQVIGEQVEVTPVARQFEPFKLDAVLSALLAQSVR